MVLSEITGYPSTSTAVVVWWSLVWLGAAVAGAARPITAALRALPTSAANPNVVIFFCAFMLG